MAQRLAVTLVGRPGCTLCVEAEAMLRRISREIPMVLDVVDIEGDDELLKRYVFEIPVVRVGGEDIAKAPIFEAELRKRLEDAQR